MVESPSILALGKFLPGTARMEESQLFRGQGQFEAGRRGGVAPRHLKKKKSPIYIQSEVLTGKFHSHKILETTQK